MEIVITVLLCCGILISINTRRKMMMWRSANSSGVLARAITQLVGTAGGLYLSLELLLTFIGIPEEIWNPPSVYYFKPLAVVSLFIAILQPYGLRLIAYIRKRRSA